MRGGAEAGVWSESAGGPDLPTLAVVHGSMDRAAGLLRLSRRLDTQFRVVRYDRRGYGRSLSVGPPWTVDANVDDLEAIVRASPVLPVTLFGHSFGGNVVLALAARRPELVSAVVVYETPMSWFDWWPGNSAGADAVVIPEVPCKLDELAAELQSRVNVQRPFGLVVVAQGARFVEDAKTADSEPAVNSLKASLSPMATEPSGAYAINRSGSAAETISNGLQQRTALVAKPMVLGPWVRGGASTAVDRQLGLAYGAAAIQALDAGKDGSMVAFVPPDIKYVPLEDAINKVRTVTENNEFIQIARSLGIFLGGKQS